MNWVRLIAAILAAGVASSFTDWFFCGVLFHDKYLAHPEVWRTPGGGEPRQIVHSSLLGLLSCAAFIVICAHLGMLTVHSSFRFAVAAWVMAPLPLIAGNAVWMKFHPALVVSHSLAWLTRFLLSAAAAVFIMGAWR